MARALRSRTAGVIISASDAQIAAMPAREVHS
jgi:hypothetical protein